MYVCHCRVVSSGTIRALAEQGATTTRQVADATGAGTVCGRCRSTISLILKAVGQPVHDARDDHEEPA